MYFMGKEVASRPNKYRRAWNQATIPLVRELMENGGSIVEACRIMGISRVTHYRWMKCPTKAAYSRAMSDLLDASEAWWMRQGRENVGNRSFNTQLFNLNMVNRFKWNSAQSEQTRNVSEKRKVTVDIRKAIDESEEKNEEQHGEVIPLLKKVVDNGE